MVVAHRFRWFGWFVLCVSVILGCYLMPHWPAQFVTLASNWSFSSANR